MLYNTGKLDNLPSTTDVEEIKDIKDNVYYTAKPDAKLYAVKKEITNIVEDLFYAKLTDEQDNSLMSILQNATESIKKEYNLDSTMKVSLKGGGGCRLYNNEFHKKIPSVMSNNIKKLYNEKISDIDVTLSCDTCDDTTMMKTAALICEKIRESQDEIQKIVQPIVNGMAAEIKDAEYLKNVNNYLSYKNKTNSNIKNVEITDDKVKINDSFTMKIPTFDIEYDGKIQKYVPENKTIISIGDLIVNKPSKNKKCLAITYMHDFKVCRMQKLNFHLFRVKYVIKANGISISIALYDIGIGNDREYGYFTNRYNSPLFVKGDKIIKIGSSNTYILSSIIDDLINIIFQQSIFAWTDKKFEKRLLRILYYAMLHDLDILPIHEIFLNNLIVAKKLQNLATILYTVDDPAARKSAYINFYKNDTLNGSSSALYNRLYVLNGTKQNLYMKKSILYKIFDYIINYSIIAKFFATNSNNYKNESENTIDEHPFSDLSEYINGIYAVGKCHDSILPSDIIAQHEIVIKSMSNDNYVHLIAEPLDYFINQISIIIFEKIIPILTEINEGLNPILRLLHQQKSYMTNPRYKGKLLIYK
jgi:hypothetical protein